MSHGSWRVDLESLLGPYCTRTLTAAGSNRSLHHRQISGILRLLVMVLVTLYAIDVVRSFGTSDNPRTKSCQTCEYENISYLLANIILDEVHLDEL